MADKIPVLLVLSSFCEGQQQLFEYPARLSLLPGGFSLCYCSEERTASSLLYDGKKLVVKRSDGTFLRFAQGQSLPGIFSAPPVYGNVEVSTEQLMFFGEENRLEVRYTMYFDGQPLSCRLLFQIKKQEQAECQEKG